MWQNPELDFYSFDNFPVALQHLFSMTSTEGWVDSMFSAMSTPPEPDIQPQFSWDSKVVYHGIFYILFMIISQGTMQLFVGVSSTRMAKKKKMQCCSNETRKTNHLYIKGHH
jgi:hypothetical protein